MDILVTIIIGFVVGLVARFIKPGSDSMGFILTTVLGICGAFLGSYLGQVFGIYESGQAAGFIAAVIGAIIILAILNAIKGKR